MLVDLKKILSIIFATPVFAVILHIFLSIVLEGYIPSKYSLLIFVFGLLFLSIIPIAPVLIDAYKGTTDVFVSKRGQRPKYFLFAICMYVIGFILALLFNARLLALFLLCYATVTFSLFLINYVTKVSVHVAGVAGPLTYVVFLLGGFWIFLYLIVPIVAWERVASNAHTVSQVLIGLFDAIIVTLITLNLAIPLFNVTRI